MNFRWFYRGLGRPRTGRDHPRGCKRGGFWGVGETYWKGEHDHSGLRSEPSRPKSGSIGPVDQEIWISRTSRSVDCGYERFASAPGGP